MVRCKSLEKRILSNDFGKNAYWTHRKGLRPMLTPKNKGTENMAKWMPSKGCYWIYISGEKSGVDEEKIANFWNQW